MALIKNPPPVQNNLDKRYALNPDLGSQGTMDIKAPPVQIAQYTIRNLRYEFYNLTRGYTNTL